MMDIHHKLFQWTPSLFKIYFIQIISIIIYWILIWYFDQIYSGLELILLSRIISVFVKINMEENSNGIFHLKLNIGKEKQEILMNHLNLKMKMK